MGGTRLRYRPLGRAGPDSRQLLLEQGHEVVLHAPNPERPHTALAAVPGAQAVVTGDLASIAQINIGIGFREHQQIEKEDGPSHVFAINILARYILTALIRRPQRPVYVSFGLHRRGDASLQDLTWQHRPWRGNQAYSDTKLRDVLLAFAVTRRWPGTRSNSTRAASSQQRPTAAFGLRLRHLDMACSSNHCGGSGMRSTYQDERWSNSSRSASR